MNVNELSGDALDLEVAKIEYTNPVTIGDSTLMVFKDVPFDYHPSTNWAQGGPIIERECIDLQYQGGETDVWAADMFNADSMVYGDTPLIAAMRCYVASKFIRAEEKEPEDLAQDSGDDVFTMDMFEEGKQ